MICASIGPVIAMRQSSIQLFTAANCTPQHQQYSAVATGRQLATDPGPVVGARAELDFYGRPYVVMGRLLYSAAVVSSSFFLAYSQRRQRSEIGCLQLSIIDNPLTRELSSLTLNR